jgi:hypothetical protein
MWALYSSDNEACRVHLIQGAFPIVIVPTTTGLDRVAVAEANTAAGLFVAWFASLIFPC